MEVLVIGGTTAESLCGRGVLTVSLQLVTQCIAESLFVFIPRGKHLFASGGNALKLRVAVEVIILSFKLNYNNMDYI